MKPDHVTIVEVGPRDGLQHTAEVIDPDTRIQFINALAQSGLSVIEAGAFLDPDAVPQLANPMTVFAGIDRPEGVHYAAQVVDEAGLMMAVEARVDRVAVRAAASETYGRKVLGVTINEALARFAPLVSGAKETDLTVRAYVSTAFACPYEGAVDPDAVYRLTANLFGMGIDEVTLCDTNGMATPRQIEDVLARQLAHFNVDQLSLHLHDTRGTALANVLRALQLGVHVFDAAAGGLGADSYIPGSAGNLATEELVYMLHGMGIQTGVDLAQVGAASRILEEALGRPLPSRVLRTLETEFHDS